MASTKAITAFKARMAALQRLLNSQPVEYRLATASSQLPALQELLNIPNEFSADQATALNIAIQQTCLASSDEHRLLGIVASKVDLTATGSNVAHRSHLQDYTSIIHYPTKQMWQQIRQSPASALEVLGMLASKLGCKHPSENTSRAVAGVYLLALHGRDNALQLPFQTKRAVVDAAKAAFIKYRRMCPGMGFDTLPESPTTVYSERFEPFQAVFGRSLPYNGLPFFCY